MFTVWLCASPVLDRTVSVCLPMGPAFTFQVTGRLRLLASTAASGTFGVALPSIWKPSGTDSVTFSLAAELQFQVSHGAGIRQILALKGLDEFRNGVAEILAVVAQVGLARDGERHAVVGADEGVEQEAQAHLVLAVVAVLHHVTHQAGIE